MDSNLPARIIEQFHESLNFGEMISMIGYGSPSQDLNQTLILPIAKASIFACIPVLAIMCWTWFCSMHLEKLAAWLSYVAIISPIVICLLKSPSSRNSKKWYALTDSRLLCLEELEEVSEVISREKLLTVSSEKDRVRLTFQTVEGPLVGGGRNRITKIIQLIPLTSLPSVVGGQDLNITGKANEQVAGPKSVNPTNEYTK